MEKIMKSWNRFAHNKIALFIVRILYFLAWSVVWLVCFYLLFAVIAGGIMLSD